MPLLPLLRQVWATVMPRMRLWRPRWRGWGPLRGSFATPDWAATAFAVGVLLVFALRRPLPLLLLPRVQPLCHFLPLVPAALLLLGFRAAALDFGQLPALSQALQAGLTSGLFLSLPQLPVCMGLRLLGCLLGLVRGLAISLVDRRGYVRHHHRSPFP